MMNNLKIKNGSPNVQNGQDIKWVVQCSHVAHNEFAEIHTINPKRVFPSTLSAKEIWCHEDQL